MQSDIGKGQEHQDRQIRLADGQEAVQLGTKAQELHIIRRFEEEIRKTPQRKRIYQEAIDRAMDEAVELKTSSTDVEENESSSVKDEVQKVDPHNRERFVEATEASSSSQAIAEKDDDVFVREIELAKQLSLDSTYVDPHNREGSVEAIEASSSSQAIVEKGDDVFVREIELAKQLSLDGTYVDPHTREGSVEAIEASSSSQAIAEKGDDVFIREIELAKQLSLDSTYVDPHNTRGLWR